MGVGAIQTQSGSGIEDPKHVPLKSSAPSFRPAMPMSVFGAMQTQNGVLHILQPPQFLPQTCMSVPTVGAAAGVAFQPQQPFLQLTLPPQGQPQLQFQARAPAAQ